VARKLFVSHLQQHSILICLSLQQKQQFSGWRSCTTTYSIRDITLWDTPHTPTHSVTDDLISDVLAVDQYLIDIHQQDMSNINSSLCMVVVGSVTID